MYDTSNIMRVFFLCNDNLYPNDHLYPLHLGDINIVVSYANLIQYVYNQLVNVSDIIDLNNLVVFSMNGLIELFQTFVVHLNALRRTRTNIIDKLGSVFQEDHALNKFRNNTFGQTLIVKESKNKCQGRKHGHINSNEDNSHGA
jgi:hypothetical protein